MMRPRSDGVIRLQGPSSNALRAAATARLTSSASPSAIRASVSPVAGLGVSNVLPDAASVHCPLMNSFRGAAVNSSTVLSTVTVMGYLISFNYGSHNETTTPRSSTRGGPRGPGLDLLQSWPTRDGRAAEHRRGRRHPVPSSASEERELARPPSG